MAKLLIYGAYGYTGDLIARAAVARGLRPILGGRDAPRLETLASELGLEQRAFALDDAAAVAAGLEGIGVVVHCAGPFAHTSRAMADACLRARAHYLDITGEPAVFEALAQRDHEAKQAGIMLMPGVGFDVVPSDCLAAHLKRRLPSASHLALGFQTLTRMSRGTALTVVENWARPGLVRQGGVLTPVPAAWRTRTIDFGAGPLKAMTIPWGDVVTAYYSTGIPNIEVYTDAPMSLRWAARLSRYLGWLLGSKLIQGAAQRWIRARRSGPSAGQRQHGRSYLWGEATDDAGRRAVARLRGPEAYEMTVQTALAVMARVQAGVAPPGYQTPATAYGADFILELPGVTREDEPPS